MRRCQYSGWRSPERAQPPFPPPPSSGVSEGPRWGGAVLVAPPLSSSPWFARSEAIDPLRSIRRVRRGREAGAAWRSRGLCCDGLNLSNQRWHSRWFFRARGKQRAHAALVRKRLAAPEFETGERGARISRNSYRSDPYTVFILISTYIYIKIFCWLAFGRRLWPALRAQSARPFIRSYHGTNPKYAQARQIGEIYSTSS